MLLAEIKIVHFIAFTSSSVSEQTQLLLKKMLFLEQKLQSMETDLKTVSGFCVTRTVLKFESRTMCLKKASVHFLGAGAQIDVGS